MIGNYSFLTSSSSSSASTNPRKQRQTIETSTKSPGLEEESEDAFSSPILVIANRKESLTRWLIIVLLIVLVSRPRDSHLSTAVSFRNKLRNHVNTLLLFLECISLQENLRSQTFTDEFALPMIPVLSIFGEFPTTKGTATVQVRKQHCSISSHF